MKNILISLLSLILISGCQPPSGKETANMEQQPVEQIKDGLFMHISHGKSDPHHVLMGLMLATKMADDKDVILFFDMEGIDVVLKDSEDIPMEPFESGHTMLKTLTEKGITIMACPACLKAMGKTEEDLREGVTIAEKEKFFGFTKGRILTMDY